MTYEERDETMRRFEIAMVEKNVEIGLLRSENARLRAVVKAARADMEQDDGWHAALHPKIQQALAALDQEANPCPPIP